MGHAAESAELRFYYPNRKKKYISAGNSSLVILSYTIKANRGITKPKNTIKEFFLSETAVAPVRLQDNGLELVAANWELHRAICSPYVTTP